MVRISVVSYLNSKPFIYGLKNSGLVSEIDLSEDIPSVCAEKMITGQADIGLIPVAALPDLKNYNIISDYCIGSDGAVNSVLLLSQVPLNQIKTILLDYQSRTSVLLTRILAQNFWKINPQWKETTVEFEKEIEGSTAGIVIGDRALLMKNKFSFVYDLSAEWKKFTGLPFVFACWASKIKLNEKFIIDFNDALKSGIQKIDSIAQTEKSINLLEEDIKFYLKECIDYDFDEAKKEAMKLFLKMVNDKVPFNQL